MPRRVPARAWAHRPTASPRGRHRRGCGWPWSCCSPWRRSGRRPKRERGAVDGRPWPGFEGEQGALRREPIGPGVAAQPRAAEDAMARDDDRDRIGAARLPDGTRTAAHEPGDVGVATGIPITDLTQALPYAEAVGGARGRERQVEALQFLIEIGVELIAGDGEQRSFRLVPAPAPVD